MIDSLQSTYRKHAFHILKFINAEAKANTGFTSGEVTLAYKIICIIRVASHISKCLCNTLECFSTDYKNRGVVRLEIIYH